MPIDDLPPEIQSIMGSSDPADLQKKENFYREKYGTAEIDSIPDPRADPKPSVKPEGAPERTEDYYKATFGFGSPDDEPKPPDSAADVQQSPISIHPDFLPELRAEWGDQAEANYEASTKSIRQVQKAFGHISADSFADVMAYAESKLGTMNAVKGLHNLRKYLKADA